MTPERETKINDVQERRFQDLHIVLENVDDPHNLGAILRSCDAVGVGHVHLLYTAGRPPRMSELKTNSAASAAKWLDIKKWTTVDECVAYLRGTEGGHIGPPVQMLVTALADGGKPQWDWDMKQPTAIVVGNEHSGASPEIMAHADGIITIPMRGMVQSLNVSVATAVVLEEALRQRIISL